MGSGVSATDSQYAGDVLNHLMTHKKEPRKVEIQRIQHAFLLADFPHTGLGVADFDEGLVFVGTRYCFNHDEPLCEQCPLNNLCEGYQSNRGLITRYRT